MTVVHKIATYIKVGCLLHLITLAELVIIYILLNIFRLGAWMLEHDTVLRFFILLPVLWAPIFPQLDARSRFQDYKMVKDYFYLYDFDVRVVKHFAKSRCQRDAVLVAAKEMGLGAHCQTYFKYSGYRWYHLLPDIIFEKPVILLSRGFYKKIFFAKTYHAKIDYMAAPVKASALHAIQVKAA